MNSLVSFVILHYQDREVTDLCVQSILNMDESGDARIIIVDNDVHKEQKQRTILKDMYQGIQNIHVIHITEDKGFSYANNKGYEYAKELGAEYIVVCNNDIEFQQTDFIKRIKDAYNKFQYGVLGPDVVHRVTGEHQNPIDKRIRTEEEARFTIRMNQTALRYYGVCYPLLLLWERRNDKRRKASKAEDVTFYEHYQKECVLFGACFIFSPQFVTREDKAFLPETRFYYEEYILAYRCQKEGYEMVYVPDIKVWHETGVATKSTFKGKKKRMKFIMEQTLASCKIYLDMIQKS